MAEKKLLLGDFAVARGAWEAGVRVAASACAGTSPEAHQAALLTMKSCQIEII